jgi:dihydrofolate reductase
MSIVRCGITMSLDGYVAGPNQSLDNPLGEGGMALHEWAFGLAAWRAEHGLEGGEVNASTGVVEASLANVGACVMGRKMFGGGPGPWNASEPWNGWWGDDPPFHVPVYVVTHHARASLAMDGGTTFRFVTDGVASAIAQARNAAGDRDVVITGGAQTAQRAIAAGLLDELRIDLVPILLHGGESLLAHLRDAGATLEQTSVVVAPGVTHLTYRVASAR